jgi:hypothetical protein
MKADPDEGMTREQVEKRIWELCEEGKAIVRAEREAEAARKPKVVSQIEELPMAVWRRRARKVLDEMMEAERKAVKAARGGKVRGVDWAPESEPYTAMQTLRGMAYSSERAEREKDRRLIAQDAIDNAMSLRKRLAAHERWLRRRGITVTTNPWGGTVEIDYNPVAAFEAEEYGE